MRTLSVLSLVLMLGCGAAVQRVAEPAIVWNDFAAEGLHLRAPAGWSQAFQRVDENQPTRNYSRITVINQAEQVITIVHPRGNAELAERSFMGSYIQTALVAAVLAQQPDELAEQGMLSIELTDPMELEGTQGAYMYTITSTMLDGTVEVNHILLMMLQPPNTETTILVSTTVPADEGEQFPAQVLEIVRTLRYVPQD